MVKWGTKANAAIENAHGAGQEEELKRLKAQQAHAEREMSRMVEAMSNRARAEQAENASLKAEVSRTAEDESR